MPLVINSLRGRHTHTHIYTHILYTHTHITHTHTHTHTHVRTETILRNQACGRHAPGLKMKKPYMIIS